MTQEKLDEAKRLYETANSDQRYMLETLFPELKESEDDRIRKSLIILLQHFCKGYRVPGLNFSVSYKDMLTWLENQEEQKTANKVEPKFKVGDWIINNDVYGDVPIKIKEIGNYLYLCERQDGVIIELNKDAVLKEFKHWDITDAKDGDVLVTEPIDGYTSPFIAIYKERGLDFFNSYCFIGFNGKFYESETGHSMDKIHPATKEQCNLLFAKMKEFGYEWDAEKKELKKIEQKAAWGEEDERNLEGIIDEIEANKNFAPDSDLVTYDRFLSWLKSLKDRVQPQYKWSKEDGHVSEDLNIAAREYSYIKGAENIDEYAQYDFEKYNAFKAGAKWQSKQM